jgi:RNA polymerase sigma factor (sigma-70 family)
MSEDGKFESLHQQFEPMIYHIMGKLEIYKNQQEFYQIGCIALWEASLRFNAEKGEFKSYAYSYIIGRMKSALTSDRVKQEKESPFAFILNQEEQSSDEFTHLLAHSVIDSISTILTFNQSKWLKAYCLNGKTPSEVAKDEGVSVSAVKAWRRDAIAKLKKHCSKDLLRMK